MGSRIVAGCWLLVGETLELNYGQSGGCWLLVAGCWLLVGEGLELNYGRWGMAWSMGHGEAGLMLMFVICAPKWIQLLGIYKGLNRDASDWWDASDVDFAVHYQLRGSY